MTLEYSIKSLRRRGKRPKSMDTAWPKKTNVTKSPGTQQALNVTKSPGTQQALNVTKSQVHSRHKKCNKFYAEHNTHYDSLFKATHY